MKQILENLSAIHKSLKKFGHVRDESVSEISAFELEPRILYSASPIDFGDPNVAVDVNQDLLFATEGPGNAGGLKWDTGDAIELSDPNLSFGSSTDGTFSKAFDLASFASGDPELNALHSVQNDVTIGTGADTFNLEVGDLIFTVGGSHTFTGNTTSVSGDLFDIFVFRPDSVGDYSNGEFHKLFNDPIFLGIFDGLSLVDKPGGVTLPGGTVLPQGTFIYSLFQSNEVGTFVADSAGPGGTDITTGPVLIDGGDDGFNIDENVNGLHLVQGDFSAGGVDLQEGDILFSVEQDDSVGENTTGIKSEDIALLRFNGDLTSADATMFFDGSQVSVNSANEKIEAITFGVTNAAPTNGSISESSIDENTDTSSGVVIGTLTSDDDSPGSVTYQVVGSSPFSVTSGDQLTLTGVSLDFEATPSYTVTIRATDSLGLSSEGDLTITVNDVNEAPSIQLQNRVSSVPENNSARTKIADVVIDDDALGSETLGLSGSDSSLFEIDGTELFLKAGSALDFESNPSLDVKVTVDDPTIGTFVDDTADATVVVTNSNEAPVLANPIAPVSVLEDAASLNIDLGSTFSDVDMDSLTLSLGTVSNPSLAAASLSGSTLTIDFFANQSGSVSIPVTASDGEFSVSDTLNITVSPVNDAPILSGDTTLPDVYRDQTPSGESINGYVPSVVTEVDFGDSLDGIAIVSNAATLAEGVWQFFDPVNGRWIDVGVANSASAVVLAINTEIRFLPAAGFTGLPTPLEFVAIDSTFAGSFSGSSPIYADTTVRGGSSPFSADSGELGIAVRPFGVTVTPITPMITSESGASATFEVVLDGAPTGDVTISVASSNTSEGTVSTNALRFDATNWSTPQQVQIFGVDDFVDDGNQPFSVHLGPVVSSEPILNGMVISDVAVVNTDDDRAGIEISTTKVVTSEDGDSDEFTVRLRSKPTDNVILFIDNTNVREASVSATSLVFTPANWNVPQTVVVSGIDDGLDDSSQAFGLSLRSVSSDPLFNNLASVGVDGENKRSAIPGPVFTADSAKEPEVNSDEVSEENSEEIAEEVIDKNDAGIDQRVIERLGNIRQGVDVVANGSEQPEESTAEISVNVDVGGLSHLSGFDSGKDFKLSLVARQTGSAIGRSVESDFAQSFSTTDYEQLWSNLDNLSDRLENETVEPVVTAGAVASVASVFTAGYLAWLIRGGHLLLGLLSQLPAWSNLDLLTVLSVSDIEDGEENSSLESIVSEEQISSESKSSESQRHEIASTS